MGLMIKDTLDDDEDDEDNSDDLRTKQIQ